MDYQTLYLDLLCRHRKLQLDFARLNKYFDDMREADAKLAIVEPSSDDKEYHICGETGGYIYHGVNFDGEGCYKKMLMDDTYMRGNTSFCIPCFEKHEETEF